MHYVSWATKEKRESLRWERWNYRFYGMFILDSIVLFTPIVVRSQDIEYSARRGVRVVSWRSTYGSTRDNLPDVHIQGYRKKAVLSTQYWKILPQRK